MREVLSVYGVTISVRRVISDTTTATVKYSPVLTGESTNSATLPQFFGSISKDIFVGRKFGNDVSGHIIGKALGGLLVGGRNLFSQNSRINNSEYRIIENKVLRTLKNNQDWTAHITVSLQ